MERSQLKSANNHTLLNCVLHNLPYFTSQCLSSVFSWRYYLRWWLWTFPGVTQFYLLATCTQEVVVVVVVLVTKSYVTLLQPCWLRPARLLCPWDFPGKNTGVGCHFLLQRIFPAQGSNPRLLYCRWILDHKAACETALGLSLQLQHQIHMALTIQNLHLLQC